MNRLILAFLLVTAAACAATKPVVEPVSVACAVPVPTVAVAHAASKHPLAAASPPKVSSEPATRSASPTAPPPVAADNTAVNARDRQSGAVTPMNQGNGELDIKTTARIRWAVMGDGSLSFTAKNVKIITQDGKVTLRGPVNSAEERSAIEAAAKKVAGDSHVDDQLEVTK